MYSHLCISKLGPALWVTAAAASMDLTPHLGKSTLMQSRGSSSGFLPWIRSRGPPDTLWQWHNPNLRTYPPVSPSSTQAGHICWNLLGQEALHILPSPSRSKWLRCGVSWTHTPYGSQKSRQNILWLTLCKQKKKMVTEDWGFQKGKGNNSMDKNNSKYSTLISTNEFKSSLH
jgi:hypothetical protein